MGCRLCGLERPFAAQDAANAGLRMFQISTFVELAGLQAAVFLADGDDLGFLAMYQHVPGSDLAPRSGLELELGLILDHCTVNDVGRLRTRQEAAALLPGDR